jgi:hypothetical protein
MQWTAPTTGIAMCQNSVGIVEQWRRRQLPLMAMNGPSAGVQLTDGEEALVWNKGTQDIDAWRWALEAGELFFQFTPAPASI